MIYNDDLEHLYDKLPEFMMSSKAEITQKKYRYAFNLWCKWTNNYTFSPLTASHLHIFLYLMHLSESAKSVSKLDEAVYVISWAHKFAGFADPCKMIWSLPFVKVHIDKLVILWLKKNQLHH